MGKFLTNAGENPIGLHRMWTGPVLNYLQLEKQTEVGEFPFLIVINSTFWLPKFIFTGHQPLWGGKQISTRQISLAFFFFKHSFFVLHPVHYFRHKRQISWLEYSWSTPAYLHSTQFGCPFPFPVEKAHHTTSPIEKKRQKKKKGRKKAA